MAIGSSFKRGALQVPATQGPRRRTWLPRIRLRWMSPSSGFSTCVVISDTYISIQCSTQLVGSIEPGSLAISASLYVRIPYIGRILVVSLSGDLGGAGVTATIDAIIAAGTATLTAEQNSSGTHDLYINANVNIKMIGNVNTDEFLLLTMP